MTKNLIFCTPLRSSVGSRKVWQLCVAFAVCQVACLSDETITQERVVVQSRASSIHKRAVFHWDLLYYELLGISTSRENDGNLHWRLRHVSPNTCLTTPYMLWVHCEEGLASFVVNDETHASQGFQGFGFGDGGFQMSFGIGAFPFGIFATAFNINDGRPPPGIYVLYIWT